MSTSLYYREIPREEEHFGYRLKFILAPRLWGHDGSLGSPWTTVGRDLIPFLEGIIVASKGEEVASEAKSLKDFIEEYDEIQIKLQG